MKTAIIAPLHPISGRTSKIEDAQLLIDLDSWYYNSELLTPRDGLVMRRLLIGAAILGIAASSTVSASDLIRSRTINNGNAEAFARDIFQRQEWEAKVSAARDAARGSSDQGLVVLSKEVVTAYVSRKSWETNDYFPDETGNPIAYQIHYVCGMGSFQISGGVGNKDARFVMIVDERYRGLSNDRQITETFGGVVYNAYIPEVWALHAPVGRNGFKSEEDRTKLRAEFDEIWTRDCIH
jgi:hypothetical protein